MTHRTMDDARDDAFAAPEEQIAVGAENCPPPLPSGVTAREDDLLGAPASRPWAELN